MSDETKVNERIERDGFGRPIKHIEVSVDSSQMKMLLEQNSALQKEKESLLADAEAGREARERLSLVEQNELEKKKRALGSPDYKTVEEVKAFEEGKNSNKPNIPHVPSGTIPLSTQTPAKQENQGFNSYEGMVSDLRMRASRGDATAKQALDQLTFKVVRGAKEATLPAYQEPQKQMVSSDLIENGMLTAKPDVCNLAHNLREKKLRAMAQKGDQSAQNILDSGDY